MATDVRSTVWTSLVTHILLNGFCVKHKKETHTGLVQLEGLSNYLVFILGWTISLKR